MHQKAPRITRINTQKSPKMVNTKIGEEVNLVPLRRRPPPDPSSRRLDVPLLPWIQWLLGPRGTPDLPKTLEEVGR